MSWWLDSDPESQNQNLNWKATHSRDQATFDLTIPVKMQMEEALEHLHLPVAHKQDKH